MMFGNPHLDMQGTHAMAKVMYSWPLLGRSEYCWLYHEFRLPKQLMLLHSFGCIHVDTYIDINTDIDINADTGIDINMDIDIDMDMDIS